MKLLDLESFNPTLTVDKRSVKLTVPPSAVSDFTNLCNSLNITPSAELNITDYQRLSYHCSNVTIDPHLIPSSLLPHIQYIYSKFLSHHYDQNKIFWDTADNKLVTREGLEIPRPNHGLAHSMRVAAYIPLIIDYYKTKINPTYQSFLDSYTPEKIFRLQLAALFSVVGREDETGFGTKVPGKTEDEVAAKYLSYRKNSAEAFQEYCRDNQQALELTDAQIDHYTRVVLGMGDPKVLDQKIFNMDLQSQNKSGVKIYLVADNESFTDLQTKLEDQQNLSKKIILVGNGNEKEIYIMDQGKLLGPKKITNVPANLTVVNSNNQHEYIVAENNLNLVAELLIKTNLEFQLPPSEEEIAFTVDDHNPAMDDIILHLAHVLDLYRCAGPDRLQEVIFLEKLFQRLCIDEENSPAFIRLLRFPLQAITTTGDRIYAARMTEKGELEHSFKPYDEPLFAACSSNPIDLANKLNLLSPIAKDIGIEQGPRFKSAATFDLEAIVRGLLNSVQQVEIEYNLLDELEITVGNKQYNLTKILEHNADFEQLELTTTDIDAYSALLKCALLQPSLWDGGGFPTEADYATKDPTGKFHNLSYAEKLAITVYCMSVGYQNVNNFLRSDGRKTLFGRMGGAGFEYDKEPDSYKQMVQEIILLSAIATEGLQKIVSQPISQETTMYLLRREVTNADYLDKRKQNIGQNKLTVQKGFFSTSESLTFSKIGADIKITLDQPNDANPLSKKIAELSPYKEKEALFPPGTQFRFRYSADDKHYEATPFRSIEGINPFLYSSAEMIARSKILRILKNILAAVDQLPPTTNVQRGLQWVAHEIKNQLRNIEKLDEKSKNDAIQSMLAISQFMLTYTDKSDLPEITQLLASIKTNLPLLQTKNPDTLTYPTKNNEYTKLFLAALLDDSDTIQELIRQGISIDSKDSQGISLLALAITNGDNSLIELLLNMGANFNKVDTEGNSAIIFALKHSQYPTIQFLIEWLNKNAPDINLFHDIAKRPELLSALFNAQEQFLNYIEAINPTNPSLADLELLTKAINAASENQNYLALERLANKYRVIHQVDLIHEAVRKDITLLTNLLATTSCDINSRNLQNQTALEVALLSDNRPAVRLLLKKWASPILPTADGSSLLEKAIRESDEDLCDLLLNHPDVKAKIQSGEYSFLPIAAARGDRFILEFCLVAQMPIEQIDHNSMTPLLIAAKKGHVNLFEPLERFGANFGEQDQDGNTFLHHLAAASFFNLDELYLFFEQNEIIINLDVKNKAGLTPVEIATKNKSANFITFLKSDIAAKHSLNRPSKHQALEQLEQFALHVRTLSPVDISGAFLALLNKGEYQTIMRILCCLPSTMELSEKLQPRLADAASQIRLELINLIDQLPDDDKIKFLDDLKNKDSYLTRVLKLNKGKSGEGFFNKSSIDDYAIVMKHYEHLFTQNIKPNP